MSNESQEDLEKARTRAETAKLQAETKSLSGVRGWVALLPGLISAIVAIYSVWLTATATATIEGLEQRVVAADQKLEKLKVTSDEGMVQMLSVALVLEKLAANSPNLESGYGDHAKRALAYAKSAYAALDKSARDRIESNNKQLVDDVLKSMSLSPARQ